MASNVFRLSPRVVGENNEMVPLLGKDERNEAEKKKTALGDIKNSQALAAGERSEVKKTTEHLDFAQQQQQQQHDLFDMDACSSMPVGYESVWYSKYDFSDDLLDKIAHSFYRGYDEDELPPQPKTPVIIDIQVVPIDDYEMPELIPPPILSEGEESPIPLDNVSTNNYSIDDSPSLNNSVFDVIPFESSFEDNGNNGFFGQ